MRSWTMIMVLGAILVASGLALTGSASFAASGCGGVVQDMADALTDLQEQDVAAAADRLAATAVRPLVVVTQDLGGQDTEEYLRQIIEDCPGLSTADGVWGGNVLGVVVGLDERETGVWEGGDLPALDVTATNVDTDVMNPRFAEGDLAGGLVAGLDRMASVRAEAAIAAEDGEQEGSDGSGFPWFAGGVGLTALLGGGGAAAAQVLARRRRIRQAHDAAVTAQADMAQSVVDLERERDIILLDARALAERIGLAEATPLRQSIAAMTGTVNSILTRWYGVTGQISATPDADATTYAQVVEDLRALAQPLEQATGTVAAFGEAVSRTIALEAGLEGREVAQGAAQSRIREGIVDAQGRGYRTDPAEADLRLSVDAVARAVEARQQRLVTAADEHLDLAEAAAADAEEWIIGIEQMRVDLARELTELRDRHRLLSSRVDPALEVMEALEAEYATSSWEAIAGNGSEAEAELGAATAALDASEQAQLLDVQDWDTAHEALDSAEQDLEDAAGLLEAIHTRSDDLRQAADLSPALVATARTAVGEALAFTSTHAADVTDAIEQAVEELARRLEATARGLDVPRPDPAAVMSGATQIQTELAELLAAARQEVTAADMARRRAERGMVDARRTLDDATAYARSRGRYVSRGVVGELSQLHTRLQRATLITDPVGREVEAIAIRAEVGRVATQMRRQVRTARTPVGPSYLPTGPRRGSFGGSGRSSGSRSSSRGSSSRRRSGGSSSRRRSSSGRSRSGRSSRW